MTDAYAVIGNPVAHSKSPLIHAEFARSLGEDLTYGAIHCEVADFETEVKRFQSEGGRGLNVTVPFKHRAYALAGRRSGRAEHARAVNTLIFDGGDIRGDNTDGAGLVRDLTVNLGYAIARRRILLMGAGGAAYGVCGPLLDHKPAALVVANRTVGKAADLSVRFKAVHPEAAVLAAASYSDLAGQAFDLVINATSAGLADAMPPLPAGVFAEGALAYDMVYGKRTLFLEHARHESARAIDGLGMLVEQAAESFYLWRGLRPQTAPVIAHLRAMTEG